MAGLLRTAVSGLMAFQRSIETTTHNIANANTEGYSRQRVESVSNVPDYSSVHPVGSGVSVSNIARSYDQFINGQLRSSTSAFSEVDSYKAFALQIDNLLADPDTGMEPVIQSFFNAVSDVANDPSDIPARGVMLSEAESLIHRFALVGGRFDDLKNQANNDLKTITNTVNTYSQSIADLNKRISADLSRAKGGQQPNDLLDKRDKLLTQLAELTDVSVISQSNGMVQVVMSNGQPLVMDTEASTLGTQKNKFDPTKLDIISIPTTGKPQIVSNQLAGGQLAGVVRFREEVLDPAQQKLGAIAAAITMEVNAIHQKGFDLNGNQGVALFKIKGVDEIPATAMITNTSTATVTAAFDSVNANGSDIDTSDYLLSYNGTNYVLKRMSDDTEISLIASAGFPSTLTPTNATDKLPGITLVIDQTPAINDEFFIRPAYQMANKLSLNVTNPREIAAATNLDVNGNVVLGAMPGDNRNALALAGLANSTTMFGDTASFQDSYAQIVSNVGGLTHAAEISATAQKAVLNRATEARENISGVNLDEEAANLIKFQQSYQAAAQAVSTASSLFDSLIAAVR